MKTIRILLLVIIVLVNTLSAECQKTGPNNKIKSVVVMVEKHNNLVKKQYKESETYYDIRGNVTEEIKYKNGNISKHFKYQYDSDDNKIKEEEYDPSGEIIESSEYKYENGLRVEKTIYDENKKIKSKKTYQYTTY
jgi:hypothetical protein